ncbi:hypothetical protein HUJ05_005102 [Dendroctonus ponderosae]|nr:hypothetical protein HUJ05_005102 [Dendroctonus ponderosae]
MHRHRRLVPTRSTLKLTHKPANQNQCHNRSNQPPASGSAREMDDEENQFIVDDVTKIVKDTIEGLLTGNVYQQEKVNQWSASVSEQCLSALSKLKKNFKYVVTCSIMQKTGAGLHTASSCYWDSATDGTCTVRWENKTIPGQPLNLTHNRNALLIQLFPIKSQLHPNGFHTSPLYLSSPFDMLIRNLYI